MEYYEALIPALVAAFLSYEVFRVLVPSHGVLYPFGEVREPTLWTVFLGVVGAGLGLGFIGLFRASGRLLHRFESRPVLLATAGGLALGLLSSAMPQGLPTTILFWGEYETATSCWAAAQWWNNTARPPSGSYCCSLWRRRSRSR